MGTVTSNTTWQVIVLPWADEIPTEKPDEGDPYVLTGVKALSYNRSKNSPGGNCSIIVVGQFDPDDTDYTDSPGLKVGDWAIVYSNHNIAPNNQNTDQNDDFYSATGNGVPRFFGQVEDISTDYTRDENATLRRVTRISIMEWSSFLLIPVRYDVFAIAKLQTKETGDGGAITELSSGVVAAQGDKGDTLKALQLAATTRLSPFDLAQLVLMYIDGLNVNNQNVNLNGINTDLPSIAIRMPAVPSAVFRYLGVSTGLPDHPFSSGLLTTITGVQTESIHTELGWNGLFDAQEFTNLGGTDSPSFNRAPADRPLATGFNPLLCPGASAWDILQNYCDTDINEIFTDIAYELSGDGKSIVAKPFIMIRDKPFALANLLAALDGNSSSQWTNYDDLPRIYVDSDYILKASINRSSSNTATYIKLNFAPQEIGDALQAKYASDFQGVINNVAGQKRFGGKEHFVNTNFISADPGAGKISGIGPPTSTQGGNAAWFVKLRSIVNIWYGNMYRMASATLYMKDHNVALTVGFNLQFTLGGIPLVGHIESISSSFEIDDIGNKHTNHVVQLSRLVTINDTGDLDYLSQAMFSNLRQS